MVLSKISMTQKFSSLRDTSVESRPLLRMTIGWPEGHCLSLSEGDDGRSVSQGSLGEMNEDMNFTSSNGSWLG